MSRTKRSSCPGTSPKPNAANASHLGLVLGKQLGQAPAPDSGAQAALQMGFSLPPLPRAAVNLHGSPGQRGSGSTVQGQVTPSLQDPTRINAVRHPLSPLVYPAFTPPIHLSHSESEQQSPKDGRLMWR